jgi:hypothetical protein
VPKCKIILSFKRIKINLHEKIKLTINLLKNHHEIIIFLTKYEKYSQFQFFFCNKLVGLSFLNKSSFVSLNKNIYLKDIFKNDIKYKNKLKIIRL